MSSLVLSTILIAQVTKPYHFWTKEKRYLVEACSTEYQVQITTSSVVHVTKSNRKINQHQRKIVLQDTTSLMESNIMKIETVEKPVIPQTSSELGHLLSRLSGSILFGEK